MSGGLVWTKGLTMSEVDLIGVGLNIPFFYTLCPNMTSLLFIIIVKLQTKKNKNKIKKTRQAQEGWLIFKNSTVKQWSQFQEWVSLHTPAPAH